MTKLYGDAQNFEINVIGADNVPDITPALDPDGDGFVNAFVLVKDLNITFGNDKLFSDGGNDELFGDLESFKINVQSGSNGGQRADSSALLGSDISFFFGEPGSIPTDANGINLRFGNDHLYGSFGQDKLYGDAKVFEIKLTSGGNSRDKGSFAIAYMAPIDPGATLQPFIFGDDYLDGGFGNDELYGDAQTLTLHFTVGNSGTQNDARTSQSIHLGNDVLIGDKGDDLLVGDVAFFNIMLTGGDNSKTSVAFGNQDASAIYAGELLMGMDDLHGGDGNDQLYGDVKTFTINLKAGDNLEGQIFLDARGFINPVGALYPQERFQYGADDELYGGKGDDHLFGDVESLSITLQAGNDSGGTLANFAGGQPAFPFAGIDAKQSFGSDELHGDMGDDKLYGDAKEISMHFTGGNNVEGGIFDPPPPPVSIVFLSTLAVASIEFEATSYGNDKLFGGDGHDLLVGDVQFLNMIFQAGLNANPNAGTLAFAMAGISMAFANLAPTFFGADHLDGGKGHDVMYGEGEKWDIDATAGTVAIAGIALADVSAGIRAPLIFGDDVMHGGDGNDQLYGDWKEIDISLTDGFGPGPAFSKQAVISEIKFGDDTLVGGEGDDLLVGDVLDVQHSHRGVTAVDVNNVPTTFSAPFDISFVEDITVIWGNDILTGGKGTDTFVFEIQEFGNKMQMQGDDTITDLSVGETLKFLDVLDIDGNLVIDINDLDSAVTAGDIIFSDVNLGADLKIDLVAGGGSITINTFGSMSIDNFTDLVNAGIIVDVSYTNSE